MSRNDMTVRMIFEFCETEGYAFYGHYSGRGMYGSQCVGISHNGSEFGLAMKLARHLVDHCEDEDDAIDAMELLEHASHDQLGLGTITYFPHLAPLDDLEDSDNETDGE